jgi:hypothetical protein
MISICVLEGNCGGDSFFQKGIVKFLDPLEGGFLRFFGFVKLLCLLNWLMLLLWARLNGITSQRVSIEQ